MSRPGWNDRDIGGYLGKDPEIRYTTKGTAVVNLTIAVPIYHNRETITEWVNAALFGQLAEFCCKYAKKGDFVRVTGVQITKKFTARGGEEKTAVEVQGNTFLVLRRAKDKAGLEDDAPF